MKGFNRWLTVITSLTMAVSAAYAAPKTLTNYEQLLQALEQGDEVRAIIHMDKCTVNKADVKGAADIGGSSTRINFTLFSHYKVPVNGQEKYTVATSQTLFTEHRAFGPVYAYGRLRVFEDNSAEFHAAYYDPKTYELKGAVNYNCHLGNGADQNSIVLFDASV
ncbi:VirK family protein [Aquicella lusitana]|uniref:VirK protein n=1 Tax=Aquicella lusitana TaxID=254246 RepID=A0A370GHP0_9COXI|nr:VirK family protein [Aquicella lusitana]RDI42689.1 VirK protein [Aquicella lusitana]VVC73456.1 hypothetical protein AQULUS_11960 [Aquicella lusitana]